MASSQQTPLAQSASCSSRQSCNRRHCPGMCPAGDGTCTNCGHKVTGPEPLDAQQRRYNAAIATRLATTSDVARKMTRVRIALKALPIGVHLLHDERNSRLQMEPDTGADVTVIGTRHFKLLRIPRTSLHPLPSTTTLNADGSQMFPTLEWFQDTLKLGNKSCVAKILVHEGIQTPHLSFAHCQELAIILPVFPKPILAITHVNRCAELPLPATTSSSAA
ncbi:hypothetical protein SK128_002690 [Halocaridina rubra]|uniref:Peptidase A2 domain-containing protein n=1 Tax=Halocaridina rubra TaxID=373956 RepID=A0AAN9AHI9_HALRR